MWFHDIARDHANKNARAGTPPNQITFEMLPGVRQFDTIEAQIQCPPLLHEQWKTVVLEAWDRITPQREPTGSYTKTLQGPNQRYAGFLARLETAISCTVIGEAAKKTAREITCLSLAKTLMLAKIERRRGRGRQRMKWLDGVTDSTDMNLGKLRDMVRVREAWCAVVHGVPESD